MFILLSLQGSWYKKKFAGSFRDSNERPESRSGANGLIWPATFHVNGISVRDRATTDGSFFKTKSKEAFGGLYFVCHFV